MHRSSFVVHLIDVDGEHIKSGKVFDIIYQNFPDAYVDVREFTGEEYMNIAEPEWVE